ncbi:MULTISPECIES: hypothetical protein [Cycloclasticus]|jgi:hypothetical protein|uniref:Uncharacterized protein n=2 Tax=Cycloclasticus TaxID=34067 RepID=S5TYC7_9GAMM|nr:MULTISPECIES: hypothetical protein [Cycloclasticus]AFT66951.1 hypothetical protein Q91_0913 [Cycloclasticus sp. P1]AGS40018.1 hypothetical protein CYCME_1698 [Cycloclasticus zancles 78-ME]EPD13922.1 hypothetical protein L196_00445 [Cycloclasticus pugetii]MDF1830276.1 hypothetical protein [Cycloclasticus pugetii]SHJ73674.1 hypothetical protein SAMN05519226_0120 [Cycloclasticus pugetii]
MKLLHMFTIIITLAFAITVSGCEPDGPAENAGEKIDNMTEDAAESIENAGEKLQEKVN